MVTLIHNVLTTDYVALIHDDDCVMGLELWSGASRVGQDAGLPEGSLAHACRTVRRFGNLQRSRRDPHGALLGLGPRDNVVTIATDGFDRYPSVLADLEQRRGPVDERAFEGVFRGGHAGEILDVRDRAQKQRLFAYKQQVWSAFGYSQPYLERMQSADFWQEEAARVEMVDRELIARRGLVGVR